MPKKKTAKKIAVKKAVKKKTVKKAVKKKTVKKPAVKKPSLRKKKNRPSKITPEQAFWVHYGPVLSDLKDLEQALRKMGDETFAHHVNLFKNDFECWVRDVLRDTALAQKLSKSKTKKDAHGVVVRHLKIKRV